MKQFLVLAFGASLALVTACEGPQGPPGDATPIGSPTPILATNVQYTSTTSGTLSAQEALDLLDGRIVGLGQTLAPYCGTANDDGIVGSSGGFPGGEAFCTTACSVPAHVCLLDEVYRSRALGLTVPTGRVIHGRPCSNGGFAPYTSLTEGVEVLFAGASGTVTTAGDCGLAKPYLCCR